jgi:hypothetical protein
MEPVVVLFNSERNVFDPVFFLNLKELITWSLEKD